MSKQSLTKFKTAPIHLTRWERVTLAGWVDGNIQDLLAEGDDLSDYGHQTVDLLKALLLKLKRAQEAP